MCCVEPAAVASSWRRHALPLAFLVLSSALPASSSRRSPGLLVSYRKGQKALALHQLKTAGYSIIRELRYGLVVRLPPPQTAAVDAAVAAAAAATPRAAAAASSSGQDPSVFLNSGAAQAAAVSAAAQPLLAPAAAEVAQMPAILSASIEPLYFIPGTGNQESTGNQPNPAAAAANPTSSSSIPSLDLGPAAGVQANPFTCQPPLNTSDTLVSNEVTPWGVRAINANTPEVLAAAAALSSSDVLVCVIDTGVNTTACGSDWPTVGDGLTGCSNSTSPGSCGFDWDAAGGNVHGSHVLGTVSAVRGNGKGIVGVAPGVHSLTCNPFGPQPYAFTEAILGCLDWCVAQMEAQKQTRPNSKVVINLSLGSLGPDDLSATTYATYGARDDTIICAAAGNFGNSSCFYPACYDNVVAVASVGPALVKSGFSSFYEQVDLCAPGENVLSTLPNVPPSIAEPSPPATVRTNLRLQVQVPFRRTVTLANGTRVNTTSYRAYTRPWLRLRLADGPVRTVSRRRIVDCGLGLGDSPDSKAPCPGARSRVCLIERGGGLFCRKVLNCKAGGGLAVLLYDSEAAANATGTCVPFGATLSGSCNPPDAAPLTSSDFIPTVTLSRSDGLGLKRQVARAAGQGLSVIAYIFASLQTDFQAQPSMAFLQGTSMASPHVTGAAALLWSTKPTCPAATILSMLTSTAKDLGEPGRGTTYGWGLIDVNAALQTLATTICP